MTEETSRSRHTNTKAIGTFKKGTFIQALYRHPTDKTPPPYHYIGSTDIRAAEVNVFCLTKMVWNRIATQLLVCNIVPEISDAIRYSIIPYLEDEPEVLDPYGNNVGVVSTTHDRDGMVAALRYSTAYDTKLLTKPNDMSAIVTNVDVE